MTSKPIGVIIAIDHCPRESTNTPSRPLHPKCAHLHELTSFTFAVRDLDRPGYDVSVVVPAVADRHGLLCLPLSFPVQRHDLGPRGFGWYTAGFTALAGILFGFAKANSPIMRRRAVIASLIAMMPALYYYLRFFAHCHRFAGTHDMLLGPVTVSFGVGLDLGIICSILTIGVLLLMLAGRPITARPARVPGS